MQYGTARDARDIYCKYKNSFGAEYCLASLKIKL